MNCFFGAYIAHEPFKGFTSDDQDVLAENEQYIVAYIGEVYKNGIMVSASSVLAEIEKYGLGFFKTTEGAFACSVYDKKDKTLYLYRDKMGIKPLYYCQEGKTILFSSSLRVLVEKVNSKPQIDQLALSQFFQLTYIPAPRTIYKDILKLMPATCLKIGAEGDVSLEKYWNLKEIASGINDDDYEKCKAKLREKLFASAERRMADAKEYGALLSGGFDSTIITGIISRISAKQIQTFTVGSNDKMLDESHLAEIVAKKNNTKHHVLLLDWDAIQEEVPQLLSTLDEPYADSSLIASHAISKYAKEYTDIIFTGDGGDEIFAGYNKYLVTYYSEMYNTIPRPIRQGILKPIINHLPVDSYKVQGIKKLIRSADMSEIDRRKNLMCLGFKPELLKDILTSGYVDELKMVNDILSTWPELDVQTMAQYLDYTIVLEGDMFPKGYYTSGATGIIIRSPILDEDIISYSFAMPSSYRIKGKQRKIIFKDAFSDLIPEELYKESKHGFGVPMYQWLREGLREKLKNYADEDFLREQGLFDSKKINEIINQHISGKENYYSPLWAFFVFQEWYRRNMI